MALSPMMQQYHEAKQAVGDALLLFRMGDFYELFHEDAKRGARILGLSLTSREKGKNPTAMAGFPHHQLDQYLAKIIAAGQRAAVCEQVEDAKQAKGLVKRDVIRIVSPGTVMDDALLDPAESNFLLAIVFAAGRDTNGGRVGLSWIDLSTGRFEAAVITREQLEDELARIAPVELLVSDDVDELPDGPNMDGLMVTRRPPWSFSPQTTEEILTKHFGSHTLAGFGFESQDGLALQAAGAVLDYLTETQKSSLAHIERLLAYRSEQRLEIDQATRRSLEISRTLREGSREGSLWGVMDRTVTSMGARLLGNWLANPLIDVQAIDARLDGVAEFCAGAQLCGEVRDQLNAIYDMQRLLARVSTGRTSPRDLSFVARTLACLPKIKSQLAGANSPRLAQLESRIDLCTEIRDRLEAALEENCPLLVREGGFIRAGYHAQLDAERQLMAGGKQWIVQYQADAIQRTGISSIKVGFNRVFGYYLEVTHAHRDQVPEDFIRKQTLKNAERYITPELKEHEEKVLAAEDRCREIEIELFLELRDIVAEAATRLLVTAEALAEIDVLAALAELARTRGYVRPTMTNRPVLNIVDGRHPVLDIIEPDGTFVPNSVSCEALKSCEEPGARRELETNDSRLASSNSILLITGPNMAGKSTYIRQVALLTLMAQIGSFVPASEATIGVADRIFARVGASDELSRGRSTFMVEMTETARILNTATERSLVILDEIGRGTSTYDGLSLAWAVMEYLHQQIGCRTLFATHYHELTELEHSLPGLQNLNVSVREWDDKVVFLHQIVAGAADKSYGIHVAQLAGVPREVNERAKQILERLETESEQREKTERLTSEQGNISEVASDTTPAFPARASHVAQSNGSALQLTLFDTADHPLLDTIRAIDLNGTTPLQALQLVERWQRQLAGERDGEEDGTNI
ncbi:MAG: DNA mismatch repair protein MutS [Pirellulales bacterium]